MKVAVIGNCQAAGLSSLIKMSNPEIQLYDMPPNYLATIDDRSYFDDVYKQADLIMIQYTPGDSCIEFARSDYAKSEARNAMLWPVVYFSGYTPDIGYMRNGAEVVMGPIGGYHSAYIRRRFLDGATAYETLVEYEGQPFADAHQNSFDNSIKTLKLREVYCDIIASDVIEQNCRFEKLFLTPNHPTNTIMNSLLKKAEDMVGVRLSGALPEKEILSDINIPANNQLLRNEGCSFQDIGDILINDAVKGENRMTKETLVVGYYNIYENLGRDVVAGSAAL